MAKLLRLNVMPQIVSAIHQRFPEVVSLPLISSLQASLQAPSKAVLAAWSPEQREKEESNRITRQRGLLRVYAELELAGIARPERQGALGDATFAIFRDLVGLPSWLNEHQLSRTQLTADKDLLVPSIPLATSFIKNLGPTFLPTTPSNREHEPTPAGQLDTERIEESLVNANVQDKFRKLLTAYYDALSRRAVREHTVRCPLCSRDLLLSAGSGHAGNRSSES